MTEYKEQGNKAYQTGEYSKAVQFYTMGIEQEPSNAALYSNRSAAYLKLEEYFKAKVDADKCISIDSTWSKGWWRKGTAEFEDQDYQAARSTFNEGLKHCPGDENLVAGVAKATQYLKVVESVQGPGDAKFDLDGPSQRNQEEDSNEKEETQKKEDSDESGEKKWPGTPSEEISRIKTAPNHYAVLHVSTDATNADMKKNYYTLARMLHPDKCQLEGADDAMTTVSTAYDTLTNMIKKTLYDQFLSQTGEDDKPNQTYQEWESAQEPVQLPSWLSFLLGIKGCGWIIAIVIVALMLPLIFVLFLIFLLFFIITLPYRIIMSCCFPEKYARMKEQQERELAKLEEQEQDRIFQHV